MFFPHLTVVLRYQILHAPIQPCRAIHKEDTGTKLASVAGEGVSKLGGGVWRGGGACCLIPVGDYFRSPT